MKFHAYVGQIGYTRKSAYTVNAERHERYRGGPSPEKFFSLHREGHRKPLEHVKGPGRPFFRYSDGHDDGGPGGPGESIEHLLYKETIASLTRTQLNLRGKGDHRIIITHGETEKLIPGASRAYRSDVYLRFEAEEPSELGLKWAGEIYIEIHKTNLVEPQKHDEMRALGIPMVEVTIPQDLLYQHGGADTTDELEQAYVKWLKAILESERGFIAGTVLSQSSSAAYLAKKLEEAQSALEHQGQQLAATTDALQKCKNTDGQLRQSLASAVSSANDLRARLYDFEERTASSAKKVIELTKQLRETQANERDLAEQLRLTQWVCFGAVLTAISVCLFVAWRWFAKSL